MSNGAGPYANNVSSGTLVALRLHLGAMISRPFTFLLLHSYILHLYFVSMPPIFAFYASLTTFVHHSFDLLHTFLSFGAFGFHSLLDTVRYFA